MCPLRCHRSIRMQPSICGGHHSGGQPGARIARRRLLRGIAEIACRGYSVKVDQWAGGAIVRSVMSYTMVAITFLHAVLGCCLHHSHAREGASATAQLQMSVRAESPCHDHSRPCGPAGSHQHDGGSCHEGKCVFLRPSQDDLGVKAACLGLGSVALSAPKAADLSPLDGWTSQPGCACRHLPVRSHLAKQVLLI
jgi:hypothetical protein